MEHFDEKGKVICQECGKSYGMITSLHLRSHDMTVAEYREKYQDFPVASNVAKARHRYRNVNVFDETKVEPPKNEYITDEIIIREEIEPEVKVENFAEIDIDKIPIVSKDKIDEVSSKIENEIPKNLEFKSFPNPGNVHKDKLVFLDFLYTFLSKYDIENSYFVNVMNCQVVSERIVTDISIPLLKIDIEFPDTFWHNKDMPKYLRDSKLKTLGWTIIEIPGVKPDIKVLEESLKKIKLI